VASTTVAGAVENRYESLDPAPFPRTYYRIVQSGSDGNRTYSGIIAVTAGNTWSDPAAVFVQGGFIHLNYASEDAGEGVLHLYSMDGRRIASQKTELVTASRTYRIECPLQAGMYFLSMESKSGRRFVGKIAVH